MAIAEESGESKVFLPSEEYKENAHITSMDQYKKMYKRSIEDPNGFWSEIAQDFYFKKPWTGQFLDYNFDVTHRKSKQANDSSTNDETIYVKWMEGATTNICYNILDRIIEKGMGDRVAYICVGNDPSEESRKTTYDELRALVCRMANFYKSKGLQKGDRIAICMPNTVELVVAMLAAARIGAIHTVVFSGFSATALAERIVDSRSKILVTADGIYRGTKFVPLKQIASDAVAMCRALKHHINCVIVYHHLKCPVQTTGVQSNNSTSNSHILPHPKSNGHSHLNGSLNGNGFHLNGNGVVNGSLTNGTSGKATTNGSDPPNGISNGNGSATSTTNTENIPWDPEKDIWWHDALSKASDQCEPVWVDAEDPLFIIYSSGSTGKPKGVLHTTGGYMIYSATTFKYVFNYNGGDVFFCTADLGWITGHTVNCYGSLANGATILLFDGSPFHPYPNRLWDIVDKHSVNTFYTAPTAIRSLMKKDIKYVKMHSRSSLKLLGTAGEPINPEAWKWYYEVVGNRRCPIVDTFWQTETGAPMLTPLPGCTPMKPGSATLPFFGVSPAILNDEGKELYGACEGHLVFKTPWPSIVRTIDANHKRYEMTYFNQFPGYYCVGDGAKRDEDGFYWITGRTDDLLNVSGHLLSTAEVETALVDHPAIAETAAVSSPHKLKGESIYCFIVLKDGFDYSKELEDELKKQVRNRIGAIATPEVIHPASALPKTRSGKIMRRLLRKIARDELNDFGDLSTLADDSILEELVHTKHLYVMGC